MHVHNLINVHSCIEVMIVDKIMLHFNVISVNSCVSIDKNAYGQRTKANEENTGRSTRQTRHNNGGTVTGKEGTG